MTITPELAAQIREGSQGQNAQKQQHPFAALNAEYDALSSDAMQQAEVKRQLQEAYKKGAEDFRKRAEAEKKKLSASESAQNAKTAQEMENRENARVEQLVKELNQKNYRAPLREVQCSPEREACLQCYRDNASDVLKCREVAEAFARCAQETTEQFVKNN
ncbi:TPA: hypothetical protein N0F65_003888 [Lagenidium giganteum]|uniref:MICOS complex subunit MIC19 n=1 Tax=Lagenidium giganteum TaxID=4803 RepID=A0AAV2ZDA7_9STRA|nr:TPA: hypothetical protein N0F65_003888 [Lagenidium giganteum]